MLLPVLMIPLSMRAQSAACGTRPVAFVGAGVLQYDHVDESASPAQFEGRGSNVLIGIDGVARRVCAFARVRAGIQSLAARSGSYGREHVTDIDADVALMRPVGRYSATVLSLGLQASGAFSLTTHSYIDAASSASRYRLTTVSLGPVFRMGMVHATDEVSAQVGAPVVALVDHPYTALWSGSGAPRMRFASVGQYHGVNGDVAYLRRFNRLAIRMNYRAALTRIDEVASVRSLSQALTVGFAIPLGA